MQFDMFGASLDTAINEAAPPVMSSFGSWIPPETLAFNAALRNGSLLDAVAILNVLKTEAVVGVLLASGFSISDHKDRKKVISNVQSAMVTAARLRVTGMELRALRLAEKESRVKTPGGEPFDPSDYAIAFLPPAKVGDFITHEDGFNYVVDSAFNGEKVRAIRPWASQEAANNSVHVVSLTTNAAKFAKQRYLVDQARAVENASPVMATAGAFTDLINSTFDPTTGAKLRVNDLIYTIAWEGNSPFSAVEIERNVPGEGEAIRVDARSLSRDETFAARRAFFPSVASFDLALAQTQASAVAPVVGMVVGDVASLKQERITQDVAANMRSGARVVDGAGKQYQAFSARFNYLEAHPIGADGKPEVWAGNSVFFHLDPETAVLFPNRRHDPVFIGNEISLANSLNVNNNTSINNATFARVEQENENGTTEPAEPGNLRTESGTRNRSAGEPGIVDSEPLVPGLAGSGLGAVEAGNVHGASETPSAEGVGRDSGGRLSEPALGGARVDGVVPSASLSASVVQDDLNAGSARKLTKYELNGLLVTDMTDDQLLQAKVMFAGGKRAEAVDRQIAKRAVAVGSVEQVSAIEGVSGLEAAPEKLIDQVVVLPDAIAATIAAAMEGQKVRLMRLRSTSKSQGVTLEQRLTLQAKAQSAEVAMRQMRLAIFDVEDAAVLAIKALDASLFHEHALMFSGVQTALASHISNLKDLEVRADSPQWDSMSQPERTAVLKRSRWVTGSGDLSFIGKRLLSTAWADILDGTKAIIRQNSLQLVPSVGVEMPGSEQRPADEPAVTGKENVEDDHLIKAGMLLASLTRDRGDIFALAGPNGIQSRVKVMAALLGREKVTQAEAGIGAIRDEFYKRVGVNAKSTPRAAEIEFENWVGRLVAQQASVVALAVELERQAKETPQKDVPASVRDRVVWAINRMNDVKGALTGVEAARGNGAILALEWADQAPKLVRPNRILNQFRKMAQGNGVDAERFLQELGGVPDFKMFETVSQSSLAPVETVASMQAALKEAAPMSEVYMDLLAKLQTAIFDDVTASFASGTMPVFVISRGNHVAVHPSAQQPGMVQVSRYAVNGIVGDSQYNSIEDAVRHEGLASCPRLDDAAAALVIGNAVEAEGRFQASKAQAAMDTSIAMEYTATPSATRAVNMAAQFSMFDAELKAEFEAIDQRRKAIYQARQDRFLKTRAEMESDTSAWSGSEFASRIQAVLDSLREAGPAGEETRAAIGAGFRMDGNQNRLTEETVSFRETVARRELANISTGVNRPSTTWKILSVNDLTEMELDIGKLPAPIVEAALDRLNTAGKELAVMGYKDEYEVNPSAPENARKVANQMREVVNSLMHLAPIRERIAKGHKNAKQAKLDRMEDLATEILGINTRNYPGVSSVMGSEAQAPVAPVVPSVSVAGHSLTPDNQEVTSETARKADVTLADGGTARIVETATRNEFTMRRGLDNYGTFTLVDGVPSKYSARAPWATGALREAAALFVQSQQQAAQLPGVSVAAVLNPVALERSRYPFGETTVEDRFHGSRVRVLPELAGDSAWEGTVSLATNGGRLISVKRDIRVEDGYEYMPIRISGNRLEVLKVMDAEADKHQPVTPLNASDAVAVDDQPVASLGGEKDSNIGRSWNTLRGKATITSLPYPKRAESSQSAMYEYTTADGATFRVYEDKIDETIARNEHAASPEGIAQAAAQALAYEANKAAQELASSSLAAVKAAQILKLETFLNSAGYSPMQMGQAQKALLSNVRFENEIMASFEFVEKLAARDLARSITSEDRIKPMSRLAYNRADNREQEAHEERIKNGGKKTVYNIGGFEVGAFEYAYAGHIAQKVTLDSPEGASSFAGSAPVLPAAEAIETSAFSVADPEIRVDYVLTDADRIGLGSLGEKFQDNMRAIQILRVLDREKRHAVGEELGSLARYVGWGGLKGVFDSENKQWKRQHLELRGLLTDAEWAAASRSQLDAFYTAPLVAKAMYSAVSRLGFTQGRVLEPSVGVGNFFGLMPENMRKNSMLHGVELDVLTSQIVAALYPSAKIAKATGFQDYNIPSGYFDMAIGNPPFGSQAVSDDKGTPYSGWSIHNYFFAKTIDMLRPGGIMPMVVSHNFLDKLDPHVRQWIARRAELVSGVRLPNSAFKENANTEVVTDILVFRRLDYENTLGKQDTPDWLETTDVSIENPKSGETETFSINNYFINNPRNVLGDNSATGSMYRANEYTVLPNGNLEDQLAAWVETLPQGIYVPLERSVKEIETAAIEVPDFVKPGSFFLQGDSIYQRLMDQNGEQNAEVWTPTNQRAMERMTGMIQIRETLRNQLRLERSEVDGADIEAGRRELNRVYDAFVKQHGFVNDPINKRVFSNDTESALVESLEFDYEKSISLAKAEEYGIEQRPSKAVKADIFSRRVLFPPGEVENVENAKDALLHSLNFTGGVDIEYMQRAYGKGQAEIVAELGDLLFTDPVEGLVTADEYLSGDVKTKLAELTKAVQHNSLLSRNVEALSQVIPADKLPSEIHASIGAAWVPEKIFADFAKEISGSATSFSYVAATGNWLKHEITAPTFAKNNDEFGTPAMGAVDILTLAMNSRAPEIKRKVLIDGAERYVIDEEKTEAVRHCADKIRSQWDSWLWSDGARADQLTAIYNDKFNRTVERKYDGSHLTFPGMSPALSLLAHQKNGVWRGLQDRVMLMDQVVGAGKTYEGIAMIMEMRRLGITKKPLIAVPNHLTLQWRSEFYKLYPGANVLAATPKDFEKDNRERFFSKIVTGNWDAVIVGHSSLKKISVPLEAETKIITEQFDDIADAIQDLKRNKGDKNVIRDMEKIKANLESKMARLREKGGKKDNVVDFSDLGVDAMFIDEMHEFKNLFFTTQMNRVAGLGNPAGSGKAFDLFVKIRWLQETFGENAPLITATGTPISNSLAEMFTMQRYMQYSKLKANNLHIFDAWAKQYGDVQNVYEVAPSGTGYRLSQRFAKFKNLGSLMGQYRSFSDVITLDDLKAQEAALGKVFPVPKLEGGKPQNIVATRSELQKKFFGIPEIVRDDNGNITFEIDLDFPISIEKNAEGKFSAQQTGLLDFEGIEYTKSLSKWYDTAEEAAYMTALGGVTPVMTIDPNSIVGQFDNLRQLTRATNGKINALSLTGLANKAGLDYRLIDPGAVDFADSKVNIAVGDIVETAKKWDADKGVQLVFCDLSVPLSAKAKMASKEKRIYVRDDNGDLTHKKGTLHTIKGYEGFPYFLVQTGKGNAKTFTMYDAHTGHLMKEGLDSKSVAHTLTETLLHQKDGQVRWLDEREKSPAIEPDEIDDYKNEHTIDADGDAADLEISKEDIEGSTGVSGFSIYDDMKAKLVARGIPANQIEFIHDHDTPQAKDLLFKRVNAGEVRVLFGSTPKMGAGTNVQRKLVALHHIDAPWRPSDLEQREGRIIRRGNELYERDPQGFTVKVNRYATAQTYDTRRWQLLEHKAAGLEQLRNYAGGSEMDDVANEASNSADMKAAASGNPLILKETQLATEMKKLQLLSRAHRDSDFLKRSSINSYRNFSESFGPSALSSWEAMKMQRDSAGVLAIYEGSQLAEKEQVMAAVDKIHSKIAFLGSKQSLIYRGLKFEFSRDEGSAFYKMKTPDDDTRLTDVFSRSGIVTRMDNWSNGIEGEITRLTNRIQYSIENISGLEKLLGKPFEQAEALITAIAEHGKVQRALMKSNSMGAVKPEELAAFTLAVDLQKAKLRAYGLGNAVIELERSDADEHAPDCPVKSGIVGTLEPLAADTEALLPGAVVAPLPEAAVTDMELYIKVAADSISELRKTDVFRVLIESNRIVNRAAIAAYIKDARPDLVSEVDDVMDEAHAESLERESAVAQPAALASVAAVVDVAIAEDFSKVEAALLPLGVDHVQTRMVSAMPVSVPAHWIVMNAPRPLLGHLTMQGDFLTGRFYAGIDPDDAMASQFIKENVQLDARLVVEVSRETQMALALQGNEYRNAYMKYPADERYEMLSGLLDAFRNMPFAELSKVILEVKGVVKEGAFVGTVLSVENGVVTQKINREGGTVCHDASKLSERIDIGDVMDVAYQEGRGVVKSVELASQQGR
jgi:N12 class adenine-specific DNA methylase